MKKLLTFLVCLIISSCMISSHATKIIVHGNLNKYVYAYVIPTSGVTSCSGGEGYVFGNHLTGVYGGAYEGPTRTINPSEKISGILMKMGFTILPNISPEFASSTMIISYGFLDGVRGDMIDPYSATIMIQFRDAKTQELMASYETTGYGNNDSESISDAITAAMNLFQYTLEPKIAVKFGDVYKNKFYVYLTNKTINDVNNVNLQVIYYIDGEVVHEQDVSVKAKIETNKELKVVIKRDKPAQSRKMQIRVNVSSYN